METKDGTILGKQGGADITAETQTIIVAFAEEMTTHREIRWKQKGIWESVGMSHGYGETRWYQLNRESNL